MSAPVSSSARSPDGGSASASLRWSVWVLASAGKLLEGMVVFLGGITLPLLAGQFQLGALQEGGLSAASLIGILVGAIALGGLADRFGRRPLFIAAMGLLLLGLVLVLLSPTPLWLGAGLLLIGLALGADYPLAHLVIAECMPVARRGRMVLSAFGFQALGALLATALAALLWPQGPDPASWRLLYLLPLPAVLLVLLGRLLLPRHSAGLLGGADLQAARQALMQPGGAAAADWSLLLEPPLRRATALACLPWFLQDLSTYGVGLSLPLLLRSAGDRSATRSAAVIDLMLVLGIATAIALADRWGRIPLQITGFLGCAAGLLLAGFAFGTAMPRLPLLVAGLTLFQFMTNLGPNAQTYLLAGELFPTPLRGLGAGIAAAAGKVGAVTTALVFPLALQQQHGAGVLLFSLAFTSLLGAAVTWWFRQETRDRDLLAEPLPVLLLQPRLEPLWSPPTDQPSVLPSPPPEGAAPSSAAPP